MYNLTKDICIIPSREETGLRRGMGAPNTVICKGRKETIIIDPGVWTHQYNELCNAEKKKFLKLNSISKVLLTHQHHDHILVGQFFQEKNKAEIYAHVEEKEAIENEDRHYRNFFEGFKFLEREMHIFPRWIAVAGMRYLFGKYQKMQVNQTIKDKDNIEFETKIEVIEFNSHTPGHVGYYLPEAKIVIVGDLIDLESGICLDLNSPISNFEKGIKALDNLKKIDIHTLVPGHGQIIQGEENCRKIIEIRKEKSLQLRKEIVEILQDKETTLKEVILQLIPDAKNIIKYHLMKTVIYVILQSIYLKEGLEIKKKGYKNYLTVI